MPCSRKVSVRYTCALHNMFLPRRPAASLFAVLISHIAREPTSRPLPQAEVPDIPQPAPKKPRKPRAKKPVIEEEDPDAPLFRDEDEDEDAEGEEEEDLGMRGCCGGAGGVEGLGMRGCCGRPAGGAGLLRWGLARAGRAVPLHPRPFLRNSLVYTPFATAVHTPFLPPRWHSKHHPLGVVGQEGVDLWGLFRRAVWVCCTIERNGWVCLVFFVRPFWTGFRVVLGEEWLFFWPKTAHVWEGTS